MHFHIIILLYFIFTTIITKFHLQNSNLSHNSHLFAKIRANFHFICRKFAQILKSNKSNISNYWLPKTTNKLDKLNKLNKLNKLITKFAFYLQKIRANFNSIEFDQIKNPPYRWASQKNFWVFVINTHINQFFYIISLTSDIFDK